MDVSMHASQVGNQIGKFGFVGGPAVPPTDIFVTAELVVGTKSRLSVKGFQDFVNHITSDLIFEAGTGRYGGGSKTVER